jgi:murein DD-endopeptidase MepM/ murein hydrolase activator NlpD
MPTLLPRVLRVFSPRPTLLAAGLLALAAQAQPTLSVQPEQARPGDPVLVTVRGLSAEPTGTLGTQPLRFFAVPGGFQALSSLPVEQSAGELAVTVTPPAASPEAPAPGALVETLAVQAPNWRERVLRVESKYTAPPPEVQARMEEDRAAFSTAFAQPFGPLLFTRNFAWPRKARVTAPFGDRRTFNGQVQTQHFGTDLDGKTGTPVLAANDGTVVMTRENFAAGNTVVLHHGGGLYTTYFHLSSILVKEGETVKRGKRLGNVGGTGRVTGPHLHWGAKVDGRWVDPEALLKLDFFGTPAPEASVREAAGGSGTGGR